LRQWGGIINSCDEFWLHDNGKKLHVRNDP
jgi:hypothetical protein